MGDSPDSHGRLAGDNFGPRQPPLDLVISARLTADGRKPALLCLRFRPEAERRTSNVEPRTLSEEGLQATQSQLKATSKPFGRQAVGNQLRPPCHLQACCQVFGLSKTLAGESLLISPNKRHILSFVTACHNYNLASS